MSFKFGLNLKNKPVDAPGKPAPGKRKPLLDDDEEEDVNIKTTVADGAEVVEELDLNNDGAQKSIPSNSKPSSRPKAQQVGPPKRPVQARKDDPSKLVNAATQLEAKKRAQEAAELDPSIYDYDAAYDAIQARAAAKKAAEQEAAAQGRAKYIENLLESAELRKKDRLRARDKVLQREREAEGDEFADKAKFVTAAYKAQQEEARKAEEEEKKRQEIEEEKRRKEGMAGFHRRMLLEEEKRHREAQAAMEEAAELTKKGIRPTVVEAPKEKSEVEIAEELKAQGKNVIINDEGQVADKRQLLSAGLNVVAKPKSAGLSTGGSSRQSITQPGLQSRHAGRGAQRQRQTAMIVEQLEQAAKRKADEEAEERRKLEHASKSRKTEGEILSAKERYLQRKKEKEAAKAAAGK
ncbi:uncharacterized protein EI97DRAFT_278189 [Westerdykella ornata]|uniref:Nuclear speckle splicing regulatory protein 1 N-terminal domain-containing protein n=1 Tax=Westerdykella ornata TaxID=318751 RepID=A0A6A6JNS3_WESOR|nr:uncharacterized protein EI97DRAFT_278189 [Westerdykella ornata]KAF2277914.1 hypothetical protein EI97DRAFT_278189 [Westerdykella ornata]